MQSQNPWHDPVVIAATINAGAAAVGALATVIYVFYTARILRVTGENTQTTRMIFEAYYRPFLSISFHRDPDQNMAEVSHIVEFRNVGPVLATNVAISDLLAVRWQKKQQAARSEEPHVLPPGDCIRTKISRLFPDSGNPTHCPWPKIEIEAAYEGVGQHKYIYDSQYGDDRGYTPYPLSTRVT